MPIPERDHSDQNRHPPLHCHPLHCRHCMCRCNSFSVHNELEAALIFLGHLLETTCLFFVIFMDNFGNRLTVAPGCHQLRFKIGTT
jgi:hypothetical protein